MYSLSHLLHEPESLETLVHWEGVLVLCFLSSESLGLPPVLLLPSSILGPPALVVPALLVVLLLLLLLGRRGCCASGRGGEGRSARGR